MQKNPKISFAIKKKEENYLSNFKEDTFDLFSVFNFAFKTRFKNKIK